MSLIEFNSAHIPEPTRTAKIGYVSEPAHLIQFEIDGLGSAWVLSSADVIPPVGAYVLDSVRLAENGLPTISRTPGFSSGTATSPRATYKLLDPNGEFNSWLAGMSSNGRSIVGGTIRQFTINRQDDINELNADLYLRYTLRMGGHSFNDTRVVTVDCSDIQRETNVSIFEPTKLRLTQTLERTNSVDLFTNFASLPRPIGTTQEEFQRQKMPMFEHSARYSLHPSLTVGYWLLKSGDTVEILAVDQVNADGKMSILGRGLFGSTVSTWTVSEGAEESSLPEMTWFGYFEEDPLDLAYGIFTGELLDGRKMPAGCHADVPAQWIEPSSFVSREQRIRAVKLPSKSTAKKWVENEICAFEPGVIAPNSAGKLAFIPRNSYGDSAAVASMTVDNVDLSSPLELKHDAKGLAETVLIQWGYDPIEKEYRQNSGFIDEVASLRNQSQGVTKTYQSKTINTSQSTQSEIDRLAAILHERHANPIQRLTISPAYDYWWVNVGSQVKVNLPVLDYTQNGGMAHIERQMTIVSTSHDQNTGKITWQLEGAIKRGSEVLSGGTPSLDFEKLKSAGTQLPNVSNGRLAGSVTLERGIMYWHDGDLELDVTFTPNFQGDGDFYLNVNGVLTIASTIDGKGQGDHGAGQVGLWSTQAGGSMYIQQQTYKEDGDHFRRGDLISSTSGPALTSSINSLNANITVVDGVLSGMPTSLSGSGGIVGDHHTTAPRSLDPFTIDPAPAGRGGMGFKFVSHGGSGFVGNGKIITDGGDAPVISAGVENYVPALPGRSQRGGLIWVIDGAGSLPSITDQNFSAKTGGVDVAGGYASLGQSRAFLQLNHGRIAAHYTIPAQTDEWATSHQIIRLPASQARQDSTYWGNGYFESLAISRQKDRTIELRITENATVPPSFGYPGDMGIWRTSLQSDNDEPFAWIMNDSGNWVQLDWATAHPDYRTLLLLNRQNEGTKSVMSPTRPNEPAGTHWLNSSDGSEWILGATPDLDTPFRQQGVPIGDNVVVDPRFTRQAAGYRTWIATRDGSIAPINILRQLADSIASVLVNISTVEGEFGTGVNTSGGTGGGSEGGGDPVDPVGQTGIELTSTGRTVAGTAYQDNESIVIASRGITLTLDDSTQLSGNTDNSGAFSITVPSVHDVNAGKNASLYTNNGTDETKAQLTFTYTAT